MFMKREFNIKVNADGVETISKRLPKTKCIICDIEIDSFISRVCNNACPKCFEENPQLLFGDKMSTIELTTVSESRSIFGNSFYGITKQQIEDLLNGKVLYSSGEYGTFVFVLE